MHKKFKYKERDVDIWVDLFGGDGGSALYRNKHFLKSRSIAGVSDKIIPASSDIEAEVIAFELEAKKAIDAIVDKSKETEILMKLGYS